MNGKREKPISSSCCSVHPEEILVGVCPLCLNERLLLLSASRSNDSITHCNLKESNSLNKNKHKRFFLSFSSSSFLCFFFQSQHQLHDRHSVILSPDDSFISIKFDENGATSWEKGKVPTKSLNSTWDHNDVMKETKEEMMIQHKSRASLTWLKSIGNLLHIIRPSVCHVSSKGGG